MTATAHKNLAEALLAFQADAPTLPKDGTNPHFRSKFTPLDTIVETVGPLLSKHGLVWTTLPGWDRDSGTPLLRYRLIHAASSEEIDGAMPLLLTKTDPQGQGSAITYARRYSITAVLNLVADEDDDGNSARGNSAKAPQSTTGPLATGEDIAALKRAAQGLTGGQIRLALTSCGLDAPADIPTALRLVPSAKVKSLAEALAGVER